MFKIYKAGEASASLLLRETALEPQVPEAVQAGIRRVFGQDLSPKTVVARLLADVRERGDDALREWSARIDGAILETVVIDEKQIKTAVSRIPPDLAEALEIASDRIRQFHSYQPIPEWTTTAMGGILGQRFTPIRRVGVYVPGGTAPLPSSLLMSVIPAQVAGVPELAVATPPGRAGSSVPDIILAAAAITGIETIYTVGGALAVAAFAFGTDSVAKADKIFGPGNLFTTLAKQQVYGTVGIDGLYGPTETAVVADDSANPSWVAADLLAQAEHDVLATAILFTPSLKLAKAVQIEVGRQIESLSRAETIAISLAHSGGIVHTKDLDQACRLASDFAAEHTCLAVNNIDECLEKMHNAGGLFIGERSFEVLGDYVAGPSHVMPTGGTARFASPLNVLDFMKISSIIQLDEATSAHLSPVAVRIAKAEHLTAHANAALVRMDS
jgi:histidinol dehydrogenase